MSQVNKDDWLRTFKRDEFVQVAKDTLDKVPADERSKIVELMEAMGFANNDLKPLVEAHWS